MDELTTPTIEEGPVVALPGIVVDRFSEEAATNETASGMNVFTDREFTIKTAVPAILYRLKCDDKAGGNPSFYSNAPFKNLRIYKEKVSEVSEEYQAPVERSINGATTKPVQPVIEVVTKITGQTRLKALEQKTQSSNIGLIDLTPRPLKIAAVKVEDIRIDEFGGTSVLIHSEYLRKALCSIITYYPTQKLDDKRNTVVIEEPYMALMHYRDEILHFSQNGNSTYKLAGTKSDGQNEVNVMIEHVKVLVSFFDPYYQTFMNESGDRLRRLSPVARYEELWYLFPPGMDVYVKIGDLTHAGVVFSSNYDRNNKELDIRSWSVSFDGAKFKRTGTLTSISSYNGEQDVLLLNVCPAKVWDIKDGGKRRKSFETRGRNIFQLCKGYKQVYYDGPLVAVYKTEKYGQHFKGLVIIDNSPIKNLDFHKEDNSSDRSASPNSSDTGADVRKPRRPESHVHLSEREFNDSVSSHYNSSTASSYRRRRPREIKGSDSKSVVENEKPKEPQKWASYINLTIDSTDLSAHQFMLFYPLIEGFALLAKKWKWFDISYMTEIPRRTEMIDNVVMEETKQQIIRAISHPQNNSWKLDFIQGKGEGQIVLLHGPPGVGKTYTVECAAEATGRPLISLTMADIGLDEKRIENQLTKWFGLAERFEAILLIDEADIFLERRQIADIARNGLVSVFLRKMEYFQGLLFLTTNRIGQIDDAFLSRIHVVIGYASLDEDKRKRIWKGFFKKLENDMKTLKLKPPSTLPNAPPQVEIRVSRYAKEYVLNDAEVRELKWNGREIRNAFQTAISLAGYQASKEETWEGGEGMRVVDVEVEHFKSVVMMSREFHTYMNSITMLGEDERAANRNERNDNFLPGDGKGGASMYD